MSRCVGPHGRNCLKLTLSDALRVEKKIWILTTVGKTCGLCKQYPWDFLKFVGQFLICRRGNPAFCTAQHSTKSFCRGWHSFGVWINVFEAHFCSPRAIIYVFSNYDFESWTMHKWCEKWALPHGATQDTGWFLTLPWRVLSTKR